jgi:hypothetical protein
MVTAMERSSASRGDEVRVMLNTYRALLLRSRLATLISTVVVPTPSATVSTRGVCKSERRRIGVSGGQDGSGGGGGQSCGNTIRPLKFNGDLNRALSMQWGY